MNIFEKHCIYPVCWHYTNHEAVAIKKRLRYADVIVYRTSRCVVKTCLGLTICLTELGPIHMTLIINICRLHSTLVIDEYARCARSTA